MKYSTTTEILGNPSLKLDGEESEKGNIYLAVCKTISYLTAIDLSKIIYFVENFGLKTILDNPGIMGVTQDQETILRELKDVILFGDDDKGETNVTSKSIRYR